MLAQHINKLTRVAGLILIASPVIAYGVIESYPTGGWAYLLFFLFNCLLFLINSSALLLRRRRASGTSESGGRELEELRETIALHGRTIESLVVAIDAKDQKARGHVRRTQVYAVELGKILGVDGPELEALRSGAILHDIGKLAVPEYILNKPGRLTAAEFERMKVHAGVGAEIVKGINFPHPVEDVVRYHHERWDGEGYPEGLKGEQIPLVARIIAVVDFYDTTRCDRPYRPGMRREESLALLRQKAGTAFDPDSVEKFVHNVDHFDALISPEDLREQVQLEDEEQLSTTTRKAMLTPPDENSRQALLAFGSIADAQREVTALQEIAQTIGVSLNLRDTLSLITAKLRAIIPFDICVVYLSDDSTGDARVAHAEGEEAGAFTNRRIAAGEGIVGWVLANSRSMRSTTPELDLEGMSKEVAGRIRVALVSPLIHEGRSLGAVGLYSGEAASYAPDAVALLEAVSKHASVAVNNALVFEKTRDSALSDPVTGLSNARALKLMLDQRVAECRRLKRDPLSVLCININNFRDVNETFGHAAGDRVLAAAGNIIKGQLRQMDILARAAGDEFVAVMPTASSDTAASVAERIRLAVESHQFPVRTGRTISISLSFGVGGFPGDGETSDELLAAAAEDLRRVKNLRGAADTMTTAPAFNTADSTG